MSCQPAQGHTTPTPNGSQTVEESMPTKRGEKTKQNKQKKQTRKQSSVWGQKSMCFGRDMSALHAVKAVKYLIYNDDNNDA